MSTLLPLGGGSCCKSRTDHPFAVSGVATEQKIEFGYTCQPRNSLMLVSGTIRFRYPDPLRRGLAGRALLQLHLFLPARCGLGCLPSCDSFAGEAGLPAVDREQVRDQFPCHGQCGAIVISLL